MLWETEDKICKVIELDNEKILEISDGWYIESVVCPDKKSDKDTISLTLTIKRDVNEQHDCETCMHYNKWPRYYCDECCRNWGDNYERG